VPPPPPQPPPCADPRASDRADLEAARITQRRLRDQHLAGAPLDRPETVVALLGAVQAQDYLGAKWAVAQRAQGCTDADFEEAFARGAILRTHVLRPTWHFVLPADIRWMLALTGPRVQAISAGYYRKAGLDLRLLARGDAALAGALQGGKELTRDQLSEALRAAGLPTEGLCPTLLVMHAELEAVICSGARRGKQLTYAALDERAPATRALTRDDALGRLARRYFTGHGPAQPRDFAWWSGLKLADAVAAISLLGKELEVVRVADQTFWAAAGSAGHAPHRRARGPIVRLLPNFDEYLVAFRDHALIVDAHLDAHWARALTARAGLLANHVVIVDGRIVGSWRRTLKKDQVVVETNLLAPVDGGQHAALAAEVARYGRFLGLPARLEDQGPRTKPVRARPAPRSR
jgi:Winged helix DNA-binding domain